MIQTRKSILYLQITSSCKQYIVQPTGELASIVVQFVTLTLLCTPIIIAKYILWNLYRAYTLVQSLAPEYLNCSETRPGICSSNWSTAFVVIWLHMLRSRWVKLRPCIAKSMTLLSVMLSHLDASSATSLCRWLATKETPMSVTDVHPLNVSCSRVWRFSATSANPLSVICDQKQSESQE